MKGKELTFNEKKTIYLLLAFKCLTQDNQLGILKGFFTEMIIVCFSFTVIPERDGFPIIEVV